MVDKQDLRGINRCLQRIDQELVCIRSLLGVSVAPKFVPPTFLDVHAYCIDRNNTVDAEAFLAHYEATGWRTKSGKKIDNWRKCIVTWEKRSEGKKGKELPTV